ncbi:MAG: heavy metal transporter [Proteobacteria bacterium]|nr:heavy metal transporter [Pseudomonadota bacterium]
MLFPILLILGIAHAEEDIEDIKVFVKGMVCSFCVQGVEKQFKNQKTVEQVVVDLHDSSVSIWLKEQQTLSDQLITDLIKDSGYNVESIERISTPEDQEKESTPKPSPKTKTEPNTESQKE